jgi:protein gp37
MKNGRCKNCYAMNLADRLARMGQKKYVGTTRATRDGKNIWSGHVNEAGEAEINIPLNLKKPTLIFVCSMSDIGYLQIPEELFRRIWSIMSDADWHFYQVLTKRPEHLLNRLHSIGLAAIPPHISIGVSVGDPEDLPLIDVLRHFQTEIRFVSAEPLVSQLGRINLDGISWVIGGGESGPQDRVRRCEAAWMREVRDECVRQNVAFFLKQWGTWESNPLTRLYGKVRAKEIEAFIAGQAEPLVAKKGGCSLDGRLWTEQPSEMARLLGRHKVVTLR